MRTRQGKLSEKPWKRVFVLKLKAIVLSVLAATVLCGGQASAAPQAHNIGGGKHPANKVITPPKATKPTTTLEKKRQKVVDTAVSLYNKKHVEYVHWRDRQEQKPVYRTDCSGFTYLVYRLANVGVKLINRDDDAQAKIGKLLTWDDYKAGKLRKGDLLFFWTNSANKSEIGHVGIYIGNHQMIHNATYKKNVVISNLNTKYYTDRFIVGRRVLIK